MLKTRPKLAKGGRPPKRNQDVTKADRAARLKRAERAAAGDTAHRRLVRRGLAEPLAPAPPPGETWLLDEVITAFLSQDDAILSREIADSIAKKARAGSIQAAAFLAERSQGKPKQKVELEGGFSIMALDRLLPEVPGA